MVRYVDLIEDTICAPITAQGLAGVSLVRLSGANSLSIIRSLSPFLPEKMESHRIYYGDLISPLTNEVIDQVLISYFAKGKSFTGDEVIEISSHGNPVITNNILNELFKRGSRLAEKGEFSFRSFFNGKMDLIQAESVQSLITSSNITTGRWSLKQLSGGLSKVFQSIEENLLSVLGHLEAGIDFVEQDIDPTSIRNLLPSLTMIQVKVDSLLESYNVNKNLVQGFQVLFVGETNAGKSSLFNCFSSKERAIVTDIAGTTRDLISEEGFLGSLPVRMVDTAGLRNSSDPIEKIGVAKAREAIKEADALLWVIDSSQDIPEHLACEFPEEKTFYIFNKIDLLKGQTREYNLPSHRCFFVSAKDALGIQELKGAVATFLEPKNEGDHKEVVTQVRHFKHLNEIAKQLGKSQAMILADESPDLISQELQMALSGIHSILGKKYDDQILDTIFSEFCIGK